MSSVTEHYEKHLASVYSWMAGGIDDAFSRGKQELIDIGVLGGSIRYAVDLGAGFGMHAIPLAKNGCNVLAIDSSSTLLEELKVHADGLSIVTIQDDLRNFATYLSGSPDIFLCMGDTLTHLPEKGSVKGLISSVGKQLSPGGRFVITFRDYSRELEGINRFIPVRSDKSRIFTCFLEYAKDSIQVHDILHERKDSAWVMRVSAYKKLRLETEWVKQQLEVSGFAASVGTGLSGMLRIIATKVSTP